MMKALIACLAVLTWAVSGQEVPKPGGEKNVDDDKKSMEGLWVPTKAVLGGQPLPAPALKAITLKIERDKYEVTVKGEPEPDQGTTTVNSTTDPKTMTITSTNGPNRGKSFPAIYELKGETMQVCYDLSGEKHPTEFKSVKGTHLYWVTYKRKGKEQ